MKKVNPAHVRTAFADEADSILAYFDRVAVPIAKKDVGTLATYSFLALYVAFERFLSDLFLAYLNRDCTKYKAHLKERVGKSVTDKFGARVSRMVQFRARKHFNVSDLEAIVDPKGYNLTFGSAEDLQKKASDWLVTAYARRVNLIAAHEGRLLDTARSVRDCIAHQSAGSRTTMNAQLETVETGGHNAQLGRGDRNILSVGAYLKAKRANKRRLHRYAEGLKHIAAKI